MYTIILAGGFGTRLFPLSRSSYPKQFIPLFGKLSLFQKAVIRACIFSKPNEIYIVTNEEHKFIVGNQLQEIQCACNVLTEPCGKNTLPAITYAVLKIHDIEPSAKILVLSSDQLLDASEKYRKAVSSAEELAEKYCVIFGIVPTSPHTGYGYIHPGKLIGRGYLVSEFKEKPDTKTAEEYLKQGYLWNAGLFCFRADNFLRDVNKFAPDVASAFTHQVSEAYELTPKISVDYGILEKSNDVAVVPLDTAWNDLGSFDALYSVKDKDIYGNVSECEYVTSDGKNNLVISGKMVVTIGISDMTVVDTDDVLLICPKNQSQKISSIVDKLREAGDERAVQHITVHRPWGTYTILMKSDTYLVKKLVINPHKRISLQYHNHRSEHWVVTKGAAEVTNDDNVSVIATGESTFVPVGAVHRLANSSDSVLEVIEVQNGDWLSEEDIVRCEDDFKRGSHDH